MASLWPKTTRSVLLAVLLIVLIPMLLLQAAMYYRNHNQRRDQELQANLEVARAVSVAFDAFVQDIVRQEYAIGLALTSRSHPMSVDQASEFLTQTAKQYPSIRRINWLDAQGRAIASSDPASVGNDYSDRDYFQTVSQGKEWALSDLLQARTDTKPTIAIVRGMRGGDGNLLGVLAAGIDPDQLDVVALAIERSGGASISVVDRQGRLVFRHPWVDLTWEQRDVLHRDAALRAALSGGEHVGTAPSVIDGTPRLSAATPIRSVGWAARAGRAESEVMDPIVQDLIGDAALFMAIAVAALVVALVVSRKLTMPLDTLRSYSIEIGRGNFDKRVTPRGPVEVADLGAAFNRMSEQLHADQQQLKAQNERLQVQSEKIQSQSEELQVQNEELRATNEALAEAYQTRDQLAAVVESSQDAIMRKNLAGIIVSCNQGAEQLYGYRQNELVGKSIAMLIPPDCHEDLPALLAQIAMGQRIASYETVRMRKDGTRVDVSISMSPVRQSGRIVGVSTIARDIGDRRRADEERKRLLEEVQRRAAALDAAYKELESFSYSVSHDLRAPLSSIDGLTQAVLEGYGDRLDEDGNNHLRRIRADTQQMARLIAALLHHVATRTQLDAPREHRSQPDG